MRRILLLCIIGIFSISPIFAYEPWVPQEINTLPQGQALIQKNYQELITIGGPTNYSWINVNNQVFKEAVRIPVLKEQKNSWDINLRVDINVSCKKNDLFLISFWARAEAPLDESNEGFITILMEDKTVYNKSLYKDLAPGVKWKRFVYAVKIQDNYKQNEYQAGINFGSRIQNVEIAGLEIIHFGKRVQLAELQKIETKTTYDGRSLNANWRIAADTRIEQYRKTNLELIVLNNGAPVENAEISVEMIQHDYGFGTAVNAKLIKDGNRRYIKELSRNFNKIVIENRLKWKQKSSTAKMAVMATVKWAAKNNISVRGHVLVWPGKRYLPKNLPWNSKKKMQKKILVHITNYVKMMEGKVSEWDVVNETYTNHDIMDLTGIDSMIEWYKTAQKLDPNVKLYQNDYSILAGEDRLHRDFYYNQLDYLIKKGAPIDGIGLQGHFGATPTGIDEILRRLDRFAKLGKEIQVTEFDINTSNESLQADYTRDFYTAVFSHPSTTGVLAWGFWENAHWRPECAMFRSNWSEKPNLKAYRDLVYNKWWSKESGKTNNSGKWQTRIFKGTYQVVIKSGGKSKTFTVKAVNNETIVIDFAKESIK